MTRRRWIGTTGVLFGMLMLVGVTGSGTTPDSTGDGAVERYAKYWADGGHQDSAALGSILLTYACVALALFSAGLRSLLVRRDDGPLATAVLGTGCAAAAALAAGAALINGVGLAAAETGYQPDGNHALLLESVGYYTAATAMMLAGAMALAFSLANRVARVVPQWTMVLSALLALVSLGSIYVAWVGFMLLPVWAVVVGVCLLVLRDAEEPVAG